MSRRHELDKHHHKLSDIRNIMYSMKMLAVMETHKLERFIDAHESMVRDIDLIATDFLQFNKQLIPSAMPATDIICLLGSEHGFCGDFNGKVAAKYSEYLASNDKNHHILITVGSKLQPLFPDQHDDVIRLAGADITEEIFAVVNQLSQRLGDQQQQPAALYVIYHCNQHDEVSIEQLLPPFLQIREAQTTHNTPPVLNMKPMDFFIELTEHYLYSALHHIFYRSLMIENQQRIQHLENALQHIDDKTDELSRKINILRQEEIIEEIEVILLNASSD